MCHKKQHIAPYTMTRSVIFSAVFLACCLTVPNVHCLFGGTLATVGQHPTQVVLTLPAGRICGGTIVNANHIVTSARCVLNDQNHLLAAAQVGVRAGVTTLLTDSPFTAAVIAIFPHPSYNPFTEEHDIAVLRTQANFAFDLTVATPAIEGVAPYLRVIPDNTICTVAGFNTPTAAIPNPTMQSLQIPVRARVGCNVDTLHAGTVRESMLCVGLDMPLVSTPTICDSTRGAGLLCQGRFVGVASFGFGCGSSSLPGVYTQLRFYNDWVQQQFNRTTIPQPGPTPPPGSSATPNVLSAVLFMFAGAAFLVNFA